jgi:TRAP-type C4-dicarboxylate transport system substrate-binding protein
MKRGKLMVLVGVFCLLVAMAGFPAPAQAKAFNLKLQTFQVGWEHERTVGILCPLIESMSNGTVKITPFPAGSLVPVPEVEEALRTGLLDMAIVPEGYPGTPKVAEIAGGLPYSFRNLHEAWVFMWHRGFVDILRKEYAKQNVYVIPYENYDVGLMTNKPINQIADLKGMKIRTHSSMADWVMAAGGSATYIPAGEVYTALATGVADGATWGDAGPMYEMKYPEILKNYMLPDPTMGAWNSMHISMNAWKGFTSEQKRAVEVAIIAGGRVLQQQTRAMYWRALESMAVDYGVSVNELSEEEQAKGKEVALKSWQRIAKKDPLNAEVIDMIKVFLKEKEVYLETKLPW